MKQTLPIESLGANQRFLAVELIDRGVHVELIDFENQVLSAEFSGHRELLVDIDSSIMPYAASVIAGSKPITKSLLVSCGISVPRGGQFMVSESDEAISCAERIGYPVVVKPSMGVQGRGVHTDVQTADELRLSLQSIASECGIGEVMVEEQFDAPEYRVLVNARGEYAVALRDPAYVIGDGVHTIAELARQESARRMSPRRTCLSTIVLDGEVRRFLKRRGMTLSSIPAPGSKTYLRRSSNLMLGGFAEDYTDKTHPTVIALARSALAAIPGLPYCGLDFMSRDITAAQTPESYRILELNSLPGIGMHIAPGKGKSRNAAAIIADMIFPETRRAPDRMAA